VNTKEMLDRLDQFKSLGKNWDSYGAPPINAKSIELAKTLIPGLPKTETWGVYPGTGGDVQFETWDGATIVVWDSEENDKAS